MSINIKKTINDEYLNMIVNDLVPNEPIHLAMKSRFNTACWTYSLKKEKHSIYIGTDILDNVRHKKNIEYYINSYLHHEMSHAFNTHEDIKEISDLLKKDSIPFPLFNLLEDARIEHLWRKKSKRRFKWAYYEDLPEIEEDTEPTRVMFVFIQKEGRVNSKKSSNKLVIRVREYYKRLLAAKTTFSVLQIAKDWLKEFPQTNCELQDMIIEGIISEGDLKNALIIQESGEKDKALNEDIEDIAGESPYDEEDNDVQIYEELSEIKAEASSGTHDSLYDTSASYSVDKKLAMKLIPTMEKIFKVRRRKISQSNPTNRINTRNFINSNFEKMYKKKKEVQKSKKKINLLIDCSGSMSGSPIKNARTFIYMINQFAMKNFCEGKLILSGAIGRTHEYATFSFPVRNDFIECIHANGSSEGLKDTINANKKAIKEADWTFVITDGNIGDNAIQTDMYNMLAMYVGKPESCNMSKWFKKYTARTTLDELIQVLITKI